MKKYMAYPYGVWMLIFIIAPILLVVFYAFTDKSGAPTLDNFTSMLSYASIFGRSFLLAFAAMTASHLANPAAAAVEPEYDYR